MKACEENLFTDYICSWAITPGPAAVAGAPGRPPALSGSRQYLILCTRRLSLFLNFLVQPLHTTLVGSEWTFLMCMQTRFLAQPIDLLVELGKYPHNPHWQVSSPSCVLTKRKAKWSLGPGAPWGSPPWPAKMPKNQNVNKNAKIEINKHRAHQTIQQPILKFQELYIQLIKLYTKEFIQNIIKIIN